MIKFRAFESFLVNGIDIQSKKYDNSFLCSANQCIHRCPLRINIKGDLLCLEYALVNPNKIYERLKKNKL